MTKRLRIPDELRFVRAFALTIDPGDTLGLLMEIGALGSPDVGIVRRTREALILAYHRANDLKDSPNQCATNWVACNPRSWARRINRRSGVPCHCCAVASVNASVWNALKPIPASSGRQRATSLRPKDSPNLERK